MKEIEEIRFTTVYPFVCDEERLKKDEEIESKSFNKNELDDLIPYIKKIFKSGESSDYYRNKNCNKTFLIRGSRKNFKIIVDRVNYYVFNDFALCTVEYKLQDISFADAVSIHYFINHIVEGNQAEFYYDADNIKVNGEGIECCDYNDNQKFIINNKNKNNDSTKNISSKDKNYLNLLNDTTINNYCNIAKIEEAIEKNKIGDIQDFLNQHLKDFKIEDKMEGNSNLYSYITLKINKGIEESEIRGFVSDLIQFRKNIDTLSNGILMSEELKIQNNVTVYGSEHCIVNVGINNDSNFIQSDFLHKYSKNYFLVYLIALIQNLNLQYLIEETTSSQDLELMEKLQRKIMVFLADVNFSKITNNRNRKIIYSFIRKKFDIHELTVEANESIKLISSKLKEKEKKKEERADTIRNKLIALFGIIFTIIQIGDIPNSIKILLILAVAFIISIL